MKLIERICFPTDFGKSSEVALKSVVSIAKKFGSEVNLIHVLPESMDFDKIQGFVNDKLADYVKLLEAEGVKSTANLLNGNHADLLVSFAERKKANLIVLGAGHIGKEKFKLGTNSEKIIRNASVPVWVIEKENVAIPNRVLCPIDFSDESMLALDSAIHLCRLFESELHLIHAVKRIDAQYGEWGVDIAVEQAKMVKELEVELEDLTDQLDLNGITWSKSVILGDPAGAILDVIKNENIDLLMMASSGKGTLKRFFLGSVAERVSRKVPCSFIINKSKGMIHLKLDKGITDIEAIYEDGLELAKQGFVQEAIIEWKRYVNMNELYFKAWSAIVKAYESIGDSESAANFQAKREQIQQVIWDKKVESDLKGRNYLFK